MNPVLVCLPTGNERDHLEPITRAVLVAELRVDILSRKRFLEALTMVRKLRLSA